MIDCNLFEFHIKEYHMCPLKVGVVRTFQEISPKDITFQIMAKCNLKSGLNSCLVIYFCMTGDSSID